MNKLITIDGKQIETKEYQGQRVVTTWDIAEVHERDAKRINEQFNRNINKLIAGVDYFILSREEFIRSLPATALSKFSNNNEIPLFTESGYLMLVKTFRDDLSWKIQRLLIENYFRQKEFRTMSIEDMIIASAIEIKTVKGDVAELKHKMGKVENYITLDYGQQMRMQKAIRKRVYLRSEETGVPKEKLFSALHRTLWDTFDVPSYKDIRKKDYDNALNLINTWIEKAELRNNN
jgi:hypothetical protein